VFCRESQKVSFGLHWFLAQEDRHATASLLELCIHGARDGRVRGGRSRRHQRVQRGLLGAWYANYSEESPLCASDSFAWAYSTKYRSPNASHLRFERIDQNKNATENTLFV